MISFYSSQIPKLPDIFTFSQIFLPFRILLLSDGSLTRHLHIFLGYSMKVQILETAIIPLKDYHYDSIYSKIPYPQISRQIWLIMNKNTKILYANSIWNEMVFLKYFKNPEIPLGNWLIQSELDIFRLIYKVEYIYCYTLEKQFGCRGPFWTRYYFLIHNGNILASIQEVFSSTL
uniref:hypothetical protein n=1 Tax=Rhodospora sordida TaxID=362230 RepID=UPI001FCE1BF7|nr:hypothetical protein MW557_pgp044 [Rhodospora sordida]UNJ15050.1 hypothetical protein [Rhodospora sordida]